MFLKLLITVYFLVMAFLYIIVYGSIVLLISVFISMTKGKERSKEFVYNEIAKFGRRAFTWMFSRVTIQGSENFQKSESYLVVANHQSLMDIPLVLGYLKPMPLVAKKELAKVPGISWFVKYMGGVFLDRKKTSEGAAVLRDIMKKLKEGRSFLIFPEGTRSEDGSVKKFKTAVFKIAKKTNIRILPVSIWGTVFLVPKKSLVLNPGPAFVKIHSPINPQNYPDEKALAEAVWKIVEDGVRKLKEVNRNAESLDKSTRFR